MNRVARWMIRLYPASWRARYGDEIDALLSDTGADARIVGDLARGGMRMQLKAWPFPLLALMLGLAGLLLGTGIAWLIPSTYTSQAALRIGNEPSVAAADEEISRMLTAVMSRVSLSRIIQQQVLYRDEMRVKPLEDIIVEMRRATHVEIVRSLSQNANIAFTIGFDDRDRVKARETVSALIARFQEEASNPGTQTEPRAAKMTVVDFPSLSVHPVSPSTRVIVAGGFLSGLLIAFLLRIVFRGGWIRRRFVAAALAMGAAGMVLSLVAREINLVSVTGPNQKSVFWNERFRSEASFVLPGATTADLNAIINEVTGRTSLAQIMQDPHLRLYASEQTTTPLEDVVESMRKSISMSLSIYQNRAFYSIAFEYRDRFRAQQALTVLLKKFEQVADQRLSGTAPAKPVPAIEILDRASAPIDPVKPNRYLIAGMGGVCGVFLAGIISLLRRRWKPATQMPASS